MIKMDISLSNIICHYLLLLFVICFFTKGCRLALVKVRPCLNLKKDDKKLDFIYEVMDSRVL